MKREERGREGEEGSDSGGSSGGGGGGGGQSVKLVVSFFVVSFFATWLWI